MINLFLWFLFSIRKSHKKLKFKQFQLKTHPLSFKGFLKHKNPLNIQTFPLFLLLIDQNIFNLCFMVKMLLSVHEQKSF